MPKSHKEESEAIPNSVAAAARHLYSALVLEREMIDCFLKPHEMRLTPKKIQNPDVDL